MTYANILVDKKGAVGLIQLNRPEALNALNADLLDELGQALLDFDADDEVGAIVVTGSEKAFAAGADIKEMAEAGAVQMLLEQRIDRFDRITQVKKPVIAAVSGWALAFVLWDFSWANAFVSEATAEFLGMLALHQRYGSFAEGFVSLANVLYFAGIAAIGMAVARFSFDLRRVGS
jgi:enoyl-CoA hydratase